MKKRIGRWTKEMALQFKVDNAGLSDAQISDKYGYCLDYVRQLLQFLQKVIDGRTRDERVRAAPRFLNESEVQYLVENYIRVSSPAICAANLGMTVGYLIRQVSNLRKRGVDIALNFDRNNPKPRIRQSRPKKTQMIQHTALSKKSVQIAKESPIAVKRKGAHEVDSNPAHFVIKNDHLGERLVKVSLRDYRYAKAGETDEQVIARYNAKTASLAQR